MRLLTLPFFVLLMIQLSAQVAINTTGASPDPTAILDVASLSKGMLIPRITETQRLSNTSGYSNSAHGASVLTHNTSGYANTATGTDALVYNTTGFENTAVGYSSLLFNTTGIHNTAHGAYALLYNSTGEKNTAAGYNSLLNNTSGVNNSAHGGWALYNNTTGIWNTASGNEALYLSSTGSYRTGIGFGANSIGDSLSNNTGIGYDADPTASNMVHIGNTSISWIGGQVGWSTYSDARIKNNIQEDIPGLDFISRLRPVSYQLDIDEQQRLLYYRIDTNEWPGKYDIEDIRFSGFLAQEVEEAAQSVGYAFSGVRAADDDTRLYNMSYADFVVPLVKGMQEQQKMIDQQNSVITSLQSEISTMQKQLIDITRALLNAGIVFGLNNY